MITRIQVNKQVIASNRIYGRNDPPLSVKYGKKNVKCHEVIIDGPCKIIHNPDKPLPSGAKVWIETTSPVKIVK